MLVFSQENHLLELFAYGPLEPSCCLILQMKERAATSLGYMIVGDPDHPHKDKILKALYNTAKVGFFACLPLIQV